jgi:hypothetical protein
MFPPHRPRRSPAARTVSILIACLLVAAPLTAGADRALLAWRRARHAGRRQTSSDRVSPATWQKMAAFVPGLSPGSPAPDFTLSGASGRPVSLDSFRGKRPIVLVFGSFG